MKFKYTVIVILINFLRFSESRVDYRLSLIRQGGGGGGGGGQIPADVECKSAGMVCGTDCKKRYACIAVGKDVFKPLSAGICPDGTTCLNGNCTDKPNLECPPWSDIGFRCNAIGMFPDPMDCQTFHVCNPDALGMADTNSGKCLDQWVYNPKTTYCDKKLPASNKCASYPVPLCTEASQNGALVDNPSIYYICLYDETVKVFYPSLFLCDNGKKYTGNFQCS